MKAQKTASRLKRLLVTGAACVNGACATLPPAAPPPPEECPAGAGDAHLAYELAKPVGASLTMGVPVEVSVKEGEVTAKILGDYGKLQQPIMITGRFILGRDFVFGRFTEAQLPSGAKLPVCLEAFTVNVGLGLKVLPGGTPKSPRIRANFSIYPVSRFD